MKRSKEVKRFRALLKQHGACREARRWAFNKTLGEAWAECEKSDWLAWLVEEFVGEPGFLTSTEALRSRNIGGGRTGCLCAYCLTGVSDVEVSGNKRRLEILRKKFKVVQVKL